jgi:hypothetical protein
LRDERHNIFLSRRGRGQAIIIVVAMTIAHINVLERYGESSPRDRHPGERRPCCTKSSTKPDLCDCEYVRPLNNATLASRVTLWHLGQTTRHTLGFTKVCWTTIRHSGFLLWRVCCCSFIKQCALYGPSTTRAIGTHCASTWELRPSLGQK